MNNKLRPEVLKELLGLIDVRLPNNGQVLCLSLTGSRAFGWASENMDYDIHGIFAAKDAWDWVHYGCEGGFDINLYELKYIFTHYPNYLYFEFFQNIANPVYLNPKFDYQGLMSFCSPNYCYEPISEINGLESCFTPRAALHCYRVLMVPIHFLQTRTFELDIFKLNEKHKFDMLPVIKQAYLAGIERQGRVLENYEKEKIREDLAKLLEQFREMKEKLKDEKIDTEKAEKWIRENSQLWGIQLWDGKPKPEKELKPEQEKRKKRAGVLGFLAKIIGK